MKFKKGLSLMIALALMVSPLSVLNTTAMADELETNGIVIETVDQEEAVEISEKLQTAETAAKEGGDVDSSEDEAEEENDVTDTFADSEKEGESVSADKADEDTQQSVEDEIADPEKVGGSADASAENDSELSSGAIPGEQKTTSRLLSPIMRSLQTTKVETAYLVLNDLSEEELKEVSLETVKTHLYDTDYQLINIEEGKKVVWGFYKNEDGEQVNGAFTTLGEDDTIDATSYSYGTNLKASYSMVMYVNDNGTQFGQNTVQYNVTVYISNTISEYVSTYLNSSNGTSISYTEYNETASPLTVEGLPINQRNIYIPADKYQEGETYKFHFTSSIADGRGDISVKVYTLNTFLKHLEDGEALSDEDDITDRILGSSAVGYVSKFTAPEDTDADNVFVVVYTDKSGREIAYRAWSIVVRPDTEHLSGDLYSNKSGTLTSATSRIYHSSSSTNWSITIPSEGADVWYSASADAYVYLNLTLDSAEDNYIEDDYYFSFSSADSVQTVYVGSYASKETAAAAGAANITDQVMPQNGVVTGYPFGSGSNYLYLTVVFTDGTSSRYGIYKYGNTRIPAEVDATSPLTNNRQDPYFRITGADEVVNNKIFLVENNYDKMLDSYYNYGRQTVFICDENADLKALKPTFWSGNDITNVYVGDDANQQKQESGVSVQDFSEGSIKYTVVVGTNNRRNYEVTFVKKTTGGGNLFVNGPDEREVFLTNYFENYHDVLFANIGDQTLTGITVELEDAQNVRLDEYWTANNATLPAFGDATVGASASAPVNMGKVRLLPDGSGEISGYLVFKVNGEEKYRIKLTGYASDPEITTTELKGGVLYVPYSHVLGTNNFYPGNYETYTITSGRLPEGMELIANTGEIYGVPLESGTFVFTVQVSFSNAAFSSATARLVLKVADNTNSNVYLASDDGYALQTAVGTDAGGYDFILANRDSDELFVSEGVIEEFQDFYINGVKLIPDQDYTAVSGSTRITITSQALVEYTVPGERNTLAAEFRVDGDRDNELRRTAQNLRFDDLPPKDNPSSSSSDDGDTDSEDLAENDASGNYVPYINLTIHLIDADNEPLPNLTVELHSTPRSGVTNANGDVTFANVEFGTHTVYVKDSSGKTLATKTFTLTSGSQTTVSGNSVIAVGGSSVTLTVQFRNNSLRLVSAIAKTGDDSHLQELWLVLFLSGAGLLILWLADKKRFAVIFKKQK